MLDFSVSERQRFDMLINPANGDYHNARIDRSLVQLHNWLRLQLSPFMSLSPIGPIGHPKCAAAGDPQIMCTTLKLLQKLVLSGDPWRNIAHRAGRILEEKNQRYLGRMLVDVALPNSRAIRR